MVRLFIAVAVLCSFAVATASRSEPSVEAYAKLPAVEQISLAPSGQRYAFITVVDDARKLIAVSADGKTPLFATDIGADKVSDLQWAGDDHLLVTIRHTSVLPQTFEVSRWEFSTVLSINLATRTAFVVFGRHRELDSTVHGFYGTAKIDDHWYGYFSGSRFFGMGDSFHPTEGPDLYRVDLDSGDVDMVAEGTGRGDDWLVSRAGRILAHSTYREDTGAWQVLSGDPGSRELASGISKMKEVDLIGQSGTPDRIVVRVPSDTGARFQELKLAGDNAANSPLDLPTDTLIIDPSSGLWVGYAPRGDNPTPEFFAPAAEARSRAAIKAFPGLSVGLLGFTSDLGRMIVRTSGTGDSGTFWLVDIGTGQADPIGYEYPAVKPADVGPVEMVTWKAADGLELHGVLELPVDRAPKNLPVIVLPHIDMSARDYPVFWWWSQLFVSRGYAVLRPNVRGSIGYGDAFREERLGQWGHKMQTDLSDGLVALADRGIVDPKRACIVGWGDGGYAAQAGVTLQHGVYRCAVSVGGMSDPGALLAYFHNVRAGKDGAWQRELRARLGVKSDRDAELAAISPIAHAGEADAPMLLIHGDDDINVPIEQSRSMERALKSHGKPVEFVALPNADRWFSRDDVRVAMAQAALNFVLKANPPALALGAQAEK